ncbi:PREDICTED: prisilkin-39 [Rhagoletis zephyria]|uniref:prisilkin-39 n=1 Tax=Rhagoletis zephyria TaxID=28612 RepID=UPI0008112C08|nr:PREDICTED: prisilkin-39 [Rhagoletis zephyria]
MKSTVNFCLALCLLVVMCHGVPVQRETLLSIEQPAAVVFEYQPQQLRRVARHAYPDFGFGGYPGGGYGGYPGGGYPGGGYGGYPGGGIASASSQSSASASAGSNGGYYPSGYGYIG